MQLRFHIARLLSVAHSTLLACLLLVSFSGALLLLLPGDGKKARKPRKKKDPNAPKKALSGFMFFSNANRERIKTENPGIPFGQVRCGYEVDFGSIDSFEWLPVPGSPPVCGVCVQHSCSFRGVSHCTLHCGHLGLLYPVMLHGLAVSALSAVGTVHNRGWRPTIEVMIAPTCKSSLPSKLLQVGKLLGEEWKKLSAEDKAPYEAQAAKDKERYAAAMADYKAAGGGGDADGAAADGEEADGEDAAADDEAAE
jgi:hypothetical protein